jgi:hypothetical protein
MNSSQQQEEDEEGAACAVPNNTSRISTFLRLRPTTRSTPRIVLEPLDGSVEFHVPRDAAAGCAAAGWGKLMTSTPFNQHALDVLLAAGQSITTGNATASALTAS